MNSKAVVVRGLEKSYQGHRTVDGIDLDIEDGEILALLRPNGAGKTTTVEILAGKKTRTHGSVEVLGADPARAGRGNAAGPGARIGIVSQAAGAAPELTVEELVAHVTEVLARAARGMTNAEIGRALFISEATVKTHLLRACTKLGVSGRTAAVAATERSLLKPPAS